MRDYSKVSPQIWSGRTWKEIGSDAATRLVQFYLLTAPESNMIGVYNCPVVIIAHRCCIPLEGALEGLRRLQEADFCTYDSDLEMVWVHNMAAVQVGGPLKETDNKVAGVRKDFDAIPNCLLKQGFYERYQFDFHLDEWSLPSSLKKPLASPLQAPSEPLRSTKTETETKTEKEEASQESKTPKAQVEKVNTPARPNLADDDLEIPPVLRRIA